MNVELLYLDWLLRLLTAAGVSAIVGHIVGSWLRGRREFQRIKTNLILELHENVIDAQKGISSVTVHTFPIPLLRDDAWRILLSSEQVMNFVIPHVGDPLWQLSSIYTRIRLINKTILSRQSLIFSGSRPSPGFEQILEQLDDFLVKQFEELIPAMERTKENLSRKDFRKAFMEYMVYTEYAKVAEKR